MGWIEDNKGKGPWNFEEQKDRPHYNEGNLISDYNNPVWGDSFLATHVEEMESLRRYWHLVLLTHLKLAELPLFQQSLAK